MGPGAGVKTSFCRLRTITFKYCAQMRPEESRLTWVVHPQYPLVRATLGKGPSRIAYVPFGLFAFPSI